MKEASTFNDTRFAVVVNTSTPPEFQDEDAPRIDYLELADALGAEIITPNPSLGTSRIGRLGSYLSATWNAFRRRNEYDVVLTMSEQVGLGLALLFKLTRSSKGHVMISHYLTPARKSLFVRLLHVDSHITKFICYGSAQARYLVENLSVPEEKVATILHPADADFWRPTPGTPDRMIVSAGMLARDYDTLLEAVKGLDVDVVIAAASPWVSRDTPADNGALNRVKFVRCTAAELRELYARSLFSVVPLVPANIQAGSLVIYESMAMGKAVITTANGGNLDIVREGETGRYSPPGDAVALRQAIVRLLENPDDAIRMGERARALVEQGLNLDSYVEKVVGLVRGLPKPSEAIDRTPTSVGMR